MNEIKENGYVRWKSLLMAFGGVLITIFLYLDSKMVSKAEFAQFESRVIDSIGELRADIRVAAKKR